MMFTQNDTQRTKEQLIEELTRLRKRTTELEKSAAGRRRGEEKINKQNEFLRSIIQSLPYVIMVIDVKDYTIEMINAPAGESDSAKGVTCYALSHQRDKPCAGDKHICPIERVKKTKKSIVVEHLHHNEDGESIDVEVHAYPIFDNSGNVSKIIEYSLDISMRKQSERRLKESEVRHRVLLDAIPDMIFCIKRDGTFMDFKPAKEFEPYMPPHEFLGRKIQEVMPKNVAEPAMRRMRQALSTGEGRSLEYQLAIKDEKHDYEARFVASGEDVVLVIVRDVTERKKTEKALRLSDEKWRSLTENTDDTVVIADRNDVVQYINRTIPPTTPEGVVGKSIYEYVSKEHHDIMRNSLKGVYETENPDSYEVTLDMSAINPNMGTLWFNTKIVPMKFDKEVTGVIMIATNITERKRIEEKLYKTVSDLERFNRLAVGREQRMIELKKEVNELLCSMGRKEKYRIPTSENVKDKKDGKNG